MDSLDWKYNPYLLCLKVNSCVIVYQGKLLANRILYSEAQVFENNPSIHFIIITEIRINYSDCRYYPLKRVFLLDFMRNYIFCRCKIY